MHKIFLNEYFKAIYERYKGAKLPIKTVIIDFLGEQNLDEEYREDGAELFIENAKYDQEKDKITIRSKNFNVTISPKSISGSLNIVAFTVISKSLK